MNTIIRECSNCGYTAKEDGNFSYLGDSVWACPCCCSKYTKIKEVVAKRRINHYTQRRCACE